MCMIDSGDGYVTMIREEDRAAKKQHKCSECARLIEPGEVYRFEFFTFDGSRSMHKTCAHCRVVRAWLNDECGGFLFGAVEEDIREHAHEGGYGMDVLRLAVGMSQKWRRRDGQLRPVPAVPPTSIEKGKPHD